MKCISPHLVVNTSIKSTKDYLSYKNLVEGNFKLRGVAYSFLVCTHVPTKHLALFIEFFDKDKNRVHLRFWIHGKQSFLNLPLCKVSQGVRNLYDIFLVQTSTKLCAILH